MCVKKWSELGHGKTSNVHRALPLEHRFLLKPVFYVFSSRSGVSSEMISQSVNSQEFHYSSRHSIVDVERRMSLNPLRKLGLKDYF